MSDQETTERDASQISDARAGSTLPSVSVVGDAEQDWTLPVVESTSNHNEDRSFLKFHGQFLGFGTTQRERHGPHETTYAVPGSIPKCSACRWFELRIFYSDDQDCYVIHFAGRSVVPGESQRFRFVRAWTAYELIEQLTIRDNDTPPYLSQPASLALAQAAGFDEDVQKAYTSRRTTV